VSQGRERNRRGAKRMIDGRDKVDRPEGVASKVLEVGRSQTRRLRDQSRK